MKESDLRSVPVLDTVYAQHKHTLVTGYQVKLFIS